jgi:hypothetical protein
VIDRLGRAAAQALAAGQVVDEHRILGIVGDGVFEPRSYDLVRDSGCLTL